jgi:hypothetical protein
VGVAAPLTVSARSPSPTISQTMNAAVRRECGERDASADQQVELEPAPAVGARGFLRFGGFARGERFGLSLFAGGGSGGVGVGAPLRFDDVPRLRLERAFAGSIGRRCG